MVAPHTKPSIPGIVIPPEYSYDHNGYHHDFVNGDFKRSSKHMVPWVCTGPVGFGVDYGINKPDNRNRVPHGKSFAWVNNTGIGPMWLAQTTETDREDELHVTYYGFATNLREEGATDIFPNWIVRFGDQSIYINQEYLIDANNITGDQWPQLSHTFTSAYGQEQLTFEVPGKTMLHLDQVKIHCMNCASPKYTKSRIGAISFFSCIGFLFLLGIIVKMLRTRKLSKDRNRRRNLNDLQLQELDYDNQNINQGIIMNNNNGNENINRNLQAPAPIPPDSDSEFFYGVYLPTRPDSSYNSTLHGQSFHNVELKNIASNTTYASADTNAETLVNENR